MLSDKTLEVLKGGTQGEWYSANMVHAERGDQMTPDEIGEYVANNVRKSKADGGFDHFLFITTPGDDSPDICHVGNGPSGPANARKIALVNPMARVCEAAAESSNALESIIVGLVERLGAGDPVVQMLDNLVKAPIDAALSNLDQEARKDG
jgi:hypothetical protein